MRLELGVPGEGISLGVVKNVVSIVGKPSFTSACRVIAPPCNVTAEVVMAKHSVQERLDIVRYRGVAVEVQAACRLE